MKRRTRLMAWLMAIIMLITSVPSSAFASAGNTEPVLESQENTEYAMESWENTEPATERQEESESIDFGESKIPDTDTVDTISQSRTEEAITKPVYGESLAENESNSGEPAAGTESNGVESDAVSTETDPDQTEQNLRPAMDFSNDEQFLELKLEKLTYWDTDSKENICMPENNRLDLSGLSQDDLSGMEFTYVFRLLIENIDGGLKQNDTFSFVLPEEYFFVESTLQPTPIYNCQLSDHDKATDQQVGLYEIHGNKVTVTLDAHVEDAAVTYVTAALKIKASVRTESLSVNEAEIRLEHSKTNIVLPAAMDESKSSSEAETETTLGRFRALFDGVALSTGRAASNMSGALRTKHTYKDKLPEGFDEIQLTVSSKDGGYINSDENPVVNFAYKVFLDEAVLYRRSEEMAMDSTFPVDSGDTQAWLVAVQEWINSHPEFEPIEYTFNMGEYFKTSSSGIYPITMQQYQMDIGTFGVEEGLLTIRMNPICCFMDNVFFEFDIDAVIDKDKLDEKPLEVIVDDLGELLFQSVGAAQGGGGTTGDTKYIVTKDAPTKVTDTTIKYKITVEAKEGERLNGLTLKDIVPSGLEVAFANVTIKYTAGRGEMVEFNGAEYTFALYDPDQTESEINSAEFTFVMELNEAQYSNFITNGINQTFTNKAALYGEDPGKPLAESDEVSTRMIAKFIQKTGKAQNLEGTKYGWTINLTTQLPLMEYGYLVDTLCWTDHQYDFDSGIQVQVDGTSYNINNFVNISDKFSGTWNGLTAQSMNAAGITGKFSTEAPTAYYYLIDEVDEYGKAIANPFSGLAENEPTNKQRAILIIPYKNLQGTTGQPRPVTIKYTTKLNMHGLGEDNNPQKYWDVMQDKGYSPIIDNEVNLLWYNRGGAGPGPAPQESVNFGKEVETSPGAVSKKGIRYNEKTQMLTWSIDVNKFGIDMGNVILEDNLPENIFEVPSNFTVNWYRYSHKDQKLTGSGAYTPAAGESCEIIAGSTAGSKTLRIDLGDVQADDLYTLTFSVKLADSSLLSVQSQSLSTANQVKITYLLGENPKEYMVEGTMGVKNTLIEKEAAGSYDYNTYELPWKVTINPNNLAINGAQFTDTLEKGFSLGRITKVEYDGVEDSAKLSQLQNQQAAAGFDKENPQFNLGDIDRTYTIYFTTVAGDQWRNEHLKSGLNNGELKNVSVENKAELHGTVGSHQIKDAHDTASNTVPVNPIAKSGIYHEDTGTIDWTLEFNLEHCNMAGLILSELLTEDGKTPIHEMDVDSLEVVKLSDDGSGTYTEKNAIGSGAEIIRLTQEGFQCKFTEVDGAGNYDTYRIRFTTCLTGDAYGQTIQNKVYLKDNDGNVANSSGTSDGGYDGSFQMDRDSNAQVRPSVKLRKISSNSTGEVKADSLALSNARFVLEAHEFTYDSDTKTLNIGNNVIQYSKARYTQDGEIYFTNIKTSNVADGKNNLICVIKEEAAADGYVIDETPRFVYFSTASGNILAGDVDKINFNSKEYTDIGALYQHLIISDKGTTTAATVVFENSPIKSEFSFTKQDMDLSNYTDKDGVITNAYTSAVDVKFVVEPLGALAGHVNNQIIETKMGEATISNLDAGTYQITETKADTGMRPGSVKLEVTWDSSTKGYKYAFVKNSGTGGLDLSPDNDNTLINALNTATVKFKKYVDYTDGTGDSTVSDNQQPLEGAAFRIVSTDPTPGGFGVAAGNIHKTAKSGSNGEVVFSGLPLGNYKIYEVYKSGSENLSVPGYVTDGDQSLVYAPINYRDRG